MATVLDGVQVVEVADWGFVPSAGTALGDWGAEVVKIEHPRHGDPIRGLITGGMIPGATGRNFIVEQLGRHKRSVGIDLGTDEGRALLYRLVERADVFLTNFLPDARERLRITYEDLKRVNPRLVYAKGHGQGARGPDARRGGYDGVSFWARGGIADRLSTPGGPYVQQRPAFGDFIGGMCIAGGVAAALFWPHFAETIGRRDLLERYPTPAARQEKRQEIAEELARHFATRSRDEWARILRASECIWGPLQSPLDLPQDPQVEANGYLLESPAPQGTVRVCANPVQFAGEPPVVRRPAQDAGAQTEEVLLELGCTWEEIARWKESGVVA